MVVSSGFAEAGDEGRALQAELRADGAASSPARAGPERRGLRELRRARGAVRHVASARAGRRLDQRDLAVGNRRVGDEPARLGSRRRSAAHPRGRQRGGARTRATCSRGRPPIRTRRSCARTSRRCATSRASAAGWTRSARARKPVLVCAPRGTERGGPAFDRGAHRRARREHRPARRVAPRSRRDPGGGSGHDVRGGRAPVVRHEDADHGRRGGVAVRGRVHAVRRGGRRARAVPAGVLDGDEAEAAHGAAALRVAEQPAGRDGAGSGRDRHVLRGARGARARSRGRVRRVRRVPAARGGRGRVGGADPARPRAGCGRRPGSCSRRSRWVRSATARPASGFVARRPAAVPAGTPRGDGRDPRPRRAPGCARAERPRPATASEPSRRRSGCCAAVSGPLDEARAADAARAVRRAAARGAGRRDPRAPPPPPPARSGSRSP